MTLFCTLTGVLALALCATASAADERMGLK